MGCKIPAARLLQLWMLLCICQSTSAFVLTRSSLAMPLRMHRRLPARIGVAPALRQRQLLLQATQGDISGDGGVVKRIFVYGDESMKQAMDKDMVQLTLSGSAHNPDETSTTICERARTSVVLADTPRRLPLGLEMCVKTMFSGEECEVKLSPQYSGPLVTPNYTLPSETSTTWRVKLREVNLHPARAFPSKAEREEFSLRKFEDPLEKLSTANRYGSQEPKRDYFNHMQHKIHPHQRVDGFAADESYR